MTTRPKDWIRRVFACWLALGALAALAAEPLKVVCWNIEWFPGLRPTAPTENVEAHMAAAREALREMDPDILIAQEIRDFAAFQELVSAVPGLEVHVVSAFGHPETGELGLQQLAIASKLRCRAAWSEAWEASRPDLHRGFAFAAVEHPDGGLLMLYSNHLKSNHGSDTPEGEQNVADIRAEQTRQLIGHEEAARARFSREEIRGWIVAGDFNTNHDGQFPKCTVVSQMTEAGFHNTWAGVPREERLTWRSDPIIENRRFEPTTFDYFFTKDLGEPRAFIIDVPRELSDHSPLAMVLEE